MKNQSQNREDININPQIESSWKEVLKEEFRKDYFKNIKKALLEEFAAKKTVYPPGSLIFNAFNQTPFPDVKIVILGQDPYHGPGQAHGLCFSVPKELKAPPSLVNIFKEIKNDTGGEIPDHGNLEKWADQGVFLLNAILSVRASSPASHRNIGWEVFTDRVIEKLSDMREGLVFMLWGKFAKDKSSLIDPDKHLILKAAHPSPFSANNGFFGCNHFSKANRYLKEQNKEEIDWQII